MKSTNNLRQNFLLVLVLFVAGFFLSAFISNKSLAQTASFYQLNFIYGTDTTSLSDWGAIDITFTGTSGYKYLNLRVDTGWVIENMPVVSIDGFAVMQTQRYWFPLSDSDTVFTSFKVGFTFTDSLKTVPPPLTDTVSVAQFTYNFSPGSDNGPSSGGKKKPGKGGKQTGGAPVAPAPAAPSHAGFPNQEAGTNECAPAAISNSLKYLNTAHPALSMPALAISIDSLKQKLGWGLSTGVPRDKYVPRKRDYMKKRKLAITTQTGGPEALGAIKKILADKQDVEIDCIFKDDPSKAHVMAVVDCVPLPDGKFKVTVRHDGDQSNPSGGTVTESGIYNPAEGEWEGALSQYADFFLIVECPTPAKPQSTPKQPKKSGSIKSNGGVSSGGGGGGMAVTANNGQTQIRNVNMNSFSDSIAMPLLGITDSVTFSCPVTFEISLDTGKTFLSMSAFASCVFSISHVTDVGPTGYYETEMRQMNLSGGSLPPTVLFRESPVDTSTGLIIQTPLGGGMFSEKNFVHVYLEISSNGGASWMPFDHILLLEADPSPSPAPAAIPTLSEWMLILFGLLLVGTGIYAMKK